MRSIRALPLALLTTLAMCMAAAPMASATQLDDRSTGSALVVGSGINGVSTNWRLTGTWFGFPNTVTCASSAFVATVNQNAPTPILTVNALTFTGCHTSSGQCTVTALYTPWPNAMMFNSTLGLEIAVPSVAGIQISGSGCLPLNATCTFAAGNTVPFAWDNSNSTATENATVTSPTCGNGTMEAIYTVRTGSAVGLGNFINVTP